MQHDFALHPATSHSACHRAQGRRGRGGRGERSQAEMPVEWMCVVFCPVQFSCSLVTLLEKSRLTPDLCFYHEVYQKRKQ